MTTGPDTVGPPWWMCAAVGLATPVSWKLQQTFVPAIVTLAVPELVVETDVGTSAELASFTLKTVPFVFPPPFELPPRVAITTATTAPIAITAAIRMPTSIRLRGREGPPPDGSCAAGASGGGGEGG